MIGLHMLHPLQGTAQQGAYISSSSSSSQHPRDGSSAISCLNQPNIVRIPAKTALPIISSVPKCRSSKVSRHHPIETVSGFSVSQSTTTATTSNGRSKTNRLGNINQADQVLLIVNDDHIKGGGVPIIGRRLPSKSIAMRSYTSPDATIQNSHNEPEMVQIDYSMLPQTVELDANQVLRNQQAPVVGRRSHRLIQQQQQQLQRAATVYQQAMFDEQVIRQDSTKKNKKSSNKQQPLSIIETRLATSQQVHHLLARPMPFDQYHHEQQQQQLTTNHSSGGNKSATSRHTTKKLHPVKYQSISIMNIAEPIAEYSLPPMQQVGGRAQKGNYFQESPNLSLYDKPKVSGRGGGGGQVAKQVIVTRGGTKAANSTLGTVPSSSCSSLCSTAATGCANKHANYQHCCSPATVCSSSSEQILDESYCEQACCQPQVEGGVCDQNNRCSETTSCNDPSCDILARAQSCCMAIQPPVSTQKSTCTNKQPKQPMVEKACTKLYNQQQQQQQQQQQLYHHHHHHHHHHQHHDNHGSHGRQARVATNNHHHHNHHHHSCQANGSMREISSKPPASCRSSSLHDGRRQLNISTSQQQFNQPMLISGRNILPVHPKPNLSQSPLVLSQQHCSNLATNQQQTKKNRGGLHNEDNTVVNQMYESLAAELKAKLGDPKMGPILLPPKDYDTMSRKQGRLTGIELRRSTNPQLVGPTASRLSSSSILFHHNNREHSINEEQIVNISGVNKGSGITTTTTTTTGSPTGSDRSSGRSQDDRSLQRSRSNSSSGLGSISMGPSSPSSPPISSNEDMRETITAQKSCSSSSGKNFSIKVNRDSSNDNDDDGDRRRHHRHHHNHNLPSVERKNSSPDNCNSSDSGHSGSGRLDSAMSSEERKVLLRDKNHSKLSLSASNNNNNNNNSSNIDSNMPTRNTGDKTGNDDRISGAKPFKTKQSMVDEMDVGSDEAVVNSRNSSSSLGKDETTRREKAAHNLNSTKISSPSLWNGRVEIPLKVNSAKNGNTYLATKQIIY